MKITLTFALASVWLTFIGPGYAAQTDKLIGLTEERLLTCAGIPSARMVSGASTFLQYGEFNEAGAFIPLGSTLFVTRRLRGCQATVVVRGGRITNVTLKTKGLISGPLACQRIFSECKNAAGFFGGVFFLVDRALRARRDSSGVTIIR